MSQRAHTNTPLPEGGESILIQPAIDFLVALHDKFEPRRRELLQRRVERKKQIDAGKMPAFLEETATIREADWRVAPIPSDLQDRRVEITGPVDRKMIINGLNSGAKVFMADLEDANSPTWMNAVSGQVNLRDAVLRKIQFESPEGKQYKLGPDPAVLFVRSRGWHLVESHFTVDGQEISGSLFDFGLYFFHNSQTLIENGSGPYFYLPKLQSHLEARLWNDVFVFAQDYLKIPQGTIRATVLIETIFGAFEMDEILYELRDHSAGLNCGRWDYIFSFIKVFWRDPKFVMPDRSQVTMDRHFLKSYVDLLIKTCHRRGIHAMGGMAAQIPIRNNAEENDKAFEKVRQDKLREAKAGHDGTWVAHPGLIPIALEVFNTEMPGPNQIDVKREDVHVEAGDLLAVPTGAITEQGLRNNIDVGLQYLESWLSGLGCVPIYNLMEDAATAEISRTQVWQWAHHQAQLDDGRPITTDLVQSAIDSQLEKTKKSLGQERFAKGKFELAAKIFREMLTNKELPEFLTLAAYSHLP